MNYIDYTYIDFIEDDSFRSFAKDVRKEDVIFWVEWIKQHPEKRPEIDLAIEIITGIDSHFNKQELTTKESELKKLLSIIDDSEKAEIIDIDKGLRIFQFVRIAAMIILLVGIGAATKFLFLDKKPSEQVSQVYKELKTPRGKRMHITLTDGTHIWLNAESSIKYPEKFTGKERIVFLNGEAYFDVAHNKKVPFAVITSEIRVNVVGTSFNVKSYSDDNTIETTLETGIIRIEELHKHSKKPDIILKPNQKFVFYKNSTEELLDKSLPAKNDETKELVKIKSKTPSIVEIKETEIFTGWKNNKLVFKNERLFELKKRLERWYNIKIGIAKPELNNKRLSGTFVNETIEDALKALRLASDINYFHRNDSIIFTDN